MNLYEVLSLVIAAIGSIGGILVVVSLLQMKKSISISREQLDQTHEQLRLTQDQLGLTQDQLQLMLKQKTDAHDEVRRTQTVNVMWTYLQSHTLHTTSSVKIVEEFSEEECRNLNEMNTLILEKTKKDMICKICQYADICSNCNEEDENEEGKKEEGKNGCTLMQERVSKNKKIKTQEYSISPRVVVWLRWNIISYLNTLETVMIAKDKSIVDPETIEEQFQFLFERKHKHIEHVLQNYLKIVGWGAYPHLMLFLQSKSKNKTKRQPPLS